MPRHCPNCKAEMQDDSLYAWCGHCDFDGYVVVRTGRIIRDDEDDEFEFDCGMMPDGQCLKAGTEECDWDCPHN